MSGKFIFFAIIAMVALVAGASIFDMCAKPVTEATTEAIEKIAQAQKSRTQERQKIERRKQRLASFVGCSANGARTNCRCYDNHGSTETILNHEQCLAVMERGLATLKDF